MSDEQKAMVFGSGKGGGSDAWFWDGAIDGAGPDEDDVFPLILQMGVWRKELTVEQARELRDLRGARWWNHLDLRVVRRYLAEQATAAKGYNPGQARVPAGDPEGGQWTTDGGSDAAESADLSISMPDKLHRAASSVAINVQRYGLRTGNEMVVVLDKEGNILSETAGDQESVKSDGLFDESAFCSVHNHPSSGSFSQADIRSFLSGPAPYMVVVGHDSTIYIAAKTAKTRQIPRLQVDERGREGIGSDDHREIIERSLEIRMKYMPEFQQKVLEGVLSTDQASKQHTHLANVEMAEWLGYDYRRYD